MPRYFHLEDSHLKDSHISKIIWVPIIWLIYSIPFCINLASLDVCKRNHDVFIGLSVAWFVVVFGPQFYLVYSSVNNHDAKPYSLTWINIPTLLYILFMIGPYCFGLYQMTKHVDMVTVKEVPKKDFFILQTVMPVLVITNLIYPLPIRVNKAAGTASAMVGFLNAFDISDVMVDYKYIQHYSTATEVWFFISIIISVILLAFPIGLDEEDKDDPDVGRVLKSFLSLVFTDLSFLVLRCMVMYEEDSLSMGLSFAYKNAISAFISIYLILKYFCQRCDDC
ncbi:uncharacterized protein LOC130655804 [Hydractinia symbiolongicarpus]|uniref:uncharacterized protein LOC130655804 n=1 Tax=Hydractinia symbiolongicarpus TaxID=13093 RepID=UPI00254EB163|nr:uncharacterized protein LOC130655804 [Hydractinia symbiolongicarpus]